MSAISIDEYLKSISFSPVLWLPKKEFARRFGVTERSIEGKIRAGKWKFGEVYVHDPDGLIHISVIGYQRWVESKWRKTEENEAALQRDAASLSYSFTGTTPSKGQAEATAGPSRHIKRKLKAID